MTNAQDEAVTRLDSAVSEVFETMLERSCDPMEGEVDTVGGRIVARIQFTGGIDGECLLYASQATASVTAEALLGTPSEPHDPMVDRTNGGDSDGRSGEEYLFCAVEFAAIDRPLDHRHT